MSKKKVSRKTAAKKLDNKKVAAKKTAPQQSEKILTDKINKLTEGISELKLRAAAWLDADGKRETGTDAVDLPKPRKKPSKQVAKVLKPTPRKRAVAAASIQRRSKSENHML
jgi:hypothetical protein